MQIKQLEYFVAVCEQLNFTRAAKQFYISQTAITLQIKSLEEELGVQLFNRTNRRVELTPAGKTFLDDARAIIRRTQDATNRARRADTIFTGNLNIGFVKGFEKTNISDLLAEFHIQYSNISLYLERNNVSELYDGVINGSLDIVLNILYSEDETSDLDSLDYQIIRKYPLMAVLPMSHPFAHRLSLRRNELTNYSLVDIKKSNRYGENSTIRRSFLDAGINPDVAYVSDDIETSILAVAAGLGYALLPSYITDHIPLKDKVVAIPVENEEEKMCIIAAWSKKSSNPALERFLENCIIPAIENNKF